MEGWTHSIGALIESKVAAACEMRIYDWIDLKEWLIPCA
jgi:hypothetical protein